jgi:hypothetical protein
MHPSRWHLAVELSGQGLVGSQYDGRSLHPFDDVGYRIGLAGACYAQQDLSRQPVLKPFDEVRDRCTLVPCRSVIGDEPERIAILDRRFLGQACGFT